MGNSDEHETEEEDGHSVIERISEKKREGGGMRERRETERGRERENKPHQ